MKKLNSILLVAAIITFIACLWVNVDRNKTIENSHTVRYIAAEGGYIDGETEQLVEDGGSSDVVIARPNSGYEFAGWSDGVSAAGRRELYVHNNITVTAYFTPTGGTTDPNDPSDPPTEAPDDKKTYTLHYTASVGGYILAKDGTISGSVLQEVTKGDNGMRVTAVANTGYEFVRWSDGVTTATRTDSNVTSDITVTAEFRRIELTLTYTAGTGGSITGETSQPVLYGESGTAVTAVPEEGYAFVRWSDGVTTATRTDSNVTSDITVTAEFRRIELTLTYAAGTGGSIVGETSQTVQYGESGTAVTAVPDEGYEFVRWSDGVTTATRTDSNVTSDTTVTAEFRRIELTLTYTAGAGGSITGETSQPVLYSESGTAVTAVPEEGYVFVRWSDGVTTATRTDSNVTSDITVTAEFAPDADYKPFAGGDGSEENPYQIDSVRRLRNMELYPDAHYVLTADIVLSEAGEGGSNFAPLFSDEGMFGGTLDGQGHKIVNLTVYNTETFYSGLFSCISASGSVTNLVLENASVSGTNYIGGIAGYTLGAVTDCTVSGSITYIDKNGYKVFAGGIAGRSEASLNGCVANVTVTVEDAQSETNVGGIVGYIAYSDSESEPMTLHHSGSITVTVDTSVDGNNARVGGLIGYANTSVYLSSSSHHDDITVSARDTYLGGLIGAGDTNLTACSTNGSLTAKAAFISYAGGLVGEGYTVTITDSYATGSVTSTGTGYYSYAGGLVGRSGYTVTVTDSYATGDVTSTSGNDSSRAGGLVGDGSSTVTDSYATGDVTSTSTGDYSYAGGLVGSGDSTVTDSYATGSVTSTSTGTYSYAGGLVGEGNTVTVTDSYATGDVTSTGNDSRAGGLVGNGNSTITDSYATGSVTSTSTSTGYYFSRAGGLVGDGYTVTVRNSYSVSCVSAEGESGNVHIGGIAGYVDSSLTLENAHWYGGDGTAAEYAVGYSNSLGIPTSIGSTRHNSVEEFYTLAGTLNAGREEPVWEHTNVNTLPTLIARTEENQQ